ncbi:MAG: pyridoxamine 5'-phosphate oxidase family protein [Oscillospiraceae bacterium]|nr:pyridoxamine 5'-phosphate oxidase family protein [Oscillospiraceae bacterium]
MFRKMRRYTQQLPENEALEILVKGSSGTLALLGDEGYPYAVPMSYVYTDGKIYFHCAKEGHKLDAIKSCNKASFCIIAEDNVVAEEFTTYFKSVIAFGKIRILEDFSEMRRAIEILSDKYCPVGEDARNKEIEGSFNRLCMLEFTIEHVTGKEAKELRAKRK